jgi:hypothetical protein
MNPNGRLPTSSRLLKLRQSAAASGCGVLVGDIGETDRRDEVLRLPCLWALGVQLVDLLE